MKKALLLSVAAGVLLLGINGLATAGKVSRDIKESALAADSVNSVETLQSSHSATHRGPEPASMVLLGVGLLGLAGFTRRNLPQ